MSHGPPRFQIRVRAAVGFLTVAMILASASCTGPARDSGTYAGKAATTADEVRSAVQIAVLGIESTSRHGLPAAYTATLLAEAEDTAVSAEGTLASIQPPNVRSDRDRSISLEVIGEAADRLSEVRIAARRADGDALEGLLPGLEASSAQLAALADELRD